MTSVTRVPECGLPAGEQLSADQAGRAVGRIGLRPLLISSFSRFRYGDGFSHSRALALQLCLSIVPLVIAVVGLSGTLRTQRFSKVLRETVLSLSPGNDDDSLRRTLQLGLERNDGEDAATAALVLGLLTGLIALTTAMGQVERGSNRIYGIRRDRPTLHKYARALVLAFTAGLPALLGFLLVVAGSAASRSVEEVYGVNSTVLLVLRWPVALALSLGAIAMLMRHAPNRRRQPGWSWLAIGATLALLLWMGFNSLLALYLEQSGSFGAVYGQLTSVMALLVWAQLTSMAIFLGVAFTAQLEAVRSGVESAALPVPDPPVLAGRADQLLDRVADAGKELFATQARALLRLLRTQPLTRGPQAGGDHQSDKDVVDVRSGDPLDEAVAQDDRSNHQ